MYAQINGQNIYYETTGSGRPLLMVHGNSEDHTIFTEAAEVLKDHFTVYLIDSRGHGLSGKVDEIHYEQLADDVAEFLEQLDLKDVVYYGFSDGGIIGLLLASRTKRVSQMILSGTNITPDGVKTWLKVLVKVLYNEKEVTFPGLEPVSGPYYEWTALRAHFIALCDKAAEPWRRPLPPPPPGPA